MFATKGRRAASVVVAVAVIVWSLDQITKVWVRAHIPLYGAIYPLPFAASFFRLTHLTNTGVAFGLLQDSGVLYILIAGVILAAIVLYARHLPWQHPLVQVAAGMQLGGALGNLTDRARLGHVTDFLDFFVRVGNRVYHYPPFNLADSSIVVGVIILMLALWRQEYREQTADPQPLHPASEGEADH